MYGYRCSNCGAETEKLQKLSDAPLTKCEVCGHETLEKTLSTGTGFCLMGHGWHKPGMTASRSTGNR